MLPTKVGGEEGGEERGGVGGEGGRPGSGEIGGPSKEVLACLSQVGRGRDFFLILFCFVLFCILFIVFIFFSFILDFGKYFIYV